MKKTRDEELDALRNRIAELELKDSQNKSQDDPGRNFYREIEAIKKKGKNAVDNIVYKDILDYTPVTLYHTNGLRIGKEMKGLHPSNAEYAFKQFERNGIILSLRKPTEEEVERYKQTDEYKKLRQAHDKDLAKNEVS